MPRMGGLELVRRLRTRNFEGKILVLSAHLSDEDIRAYEEFSVDMMMSKPFDFEEIQNAVIISNPKAVRVTRWQVVDPDSLGNSESVALSAADQKLFSLAEKAPSRDSARRLFGGIAQLVERLVSNELSA